MHAAHYIVLQVRTSFSFRSDFNNDKYTKNITKDLIGYYIDTDIPVRPPRR